MEKSDLTPAEKEQLLKDLANVCSHSTTGSGTTTPTTVTMPTTTTTSTTTKSKG